jgi:hypothetical protein
VTTITHGHTNPPPDPGGLLPALISSLNVADHAMILIAAPLAADLGICDLCDPSGPAAPAAARITWTNRLNRPSALAACALCVGVGLLGATSDGRDVTIRVAVEAVR